MADPKQIAIAERLQLKLLESFDKMLSDGSMTAADRATLARLLLSNGWSLDPSKIPQGIREKLTEHIDPKLFEDGDPDLPMVN